MSEKARFCEGCPYVPDGVIAEVEYVRQPTPSDYKRLVIAHAAPDIIEEYTQTTIHVVSTAVESTNPDVEVGDESTFPIINDGRSVEEIAQAIGNCPNPKVGKIAKALGSKGVCQAIKAK